MTLATTPLSRIGRAFAVAAAAVAIAFAAAPADQAHAKPVWVGTTLTCDGSAIGTTKYGLKDGRSVKFKCMPNGEWVAEEDTQRRSLSVAGSTSVA